MFRKLTVAVAGAALIAASPASAQSASLPAPAAEKVEAESSIAERPRGLQFYVLALAVVALVAWGAWQVLDNGDPASP
jgi:hypothetical protein